MPLRPRRAMTFGLSLVMLFATALPAYGQQPATEAFGVSKTYNNAPFAYQSRLLSDRTGFRIYRLTYPSPMVTPVQQNNTVPADFYVPKNLQPDAKYPAVICLHILDGDEQLTDLVCSVLAGRGVLAISFKMPYYGERGIAKGPEALADNPKLFIGAIRQVGEDIRRTVDLLASRPEINPERIGITGISLGGITAAAAAGAEPRLYRAGLLLAGGDLMQIIRHARETQPLSQMIDKLPPQDRAELETKIAEVDPLRFAPALRDRARDGRVLMINAGDDEVIPRPCTEKLAQALGIADRVTWFDGLGHYTTMAELPRAMRMMADFFAQDLPVGAQTSKALNGDSLGTEVPSPRTSALQQLVALVEQVVNMVAKEPDGGRCHLIDVELSAGNGDSQAIASHVRVVRGAKGRFALRCEIPVIGEVAFGQNDVPWMLAGGKTVIVGTKNPVANNHALTFVEPRHLMNLRLAAGIGGGIVMAPEMLTQWISVEKDEADGDDRTIRIAAKDQRKMPGEIRVTFSEDGRTPTAATFSVAGVQGKLTFRGWQTNTVAPNALFEPPKGLQRREVDQSDLYRMFGAILNCAAERLDADRPPLASRLQPDTIAVLARDPAGHGMLCRTQGKLILMVSGTPEQMGTAHGTLVRPMVQKIAERAVYMIGGADTLRSGDWFFNTLADIERRTQPHIPLRFLDECDAMAKAAGVSQRDGRYANLFPERFHCSGVALRGKATVGGRVLHARVLDYMRDIGFQDMATVTVFMPDEGNTWMSLGYAGLVGTVTAMNEKGLAIGEIGGRGEGDWDGVPMTFLLRDIMERAATVDEALAILHATPRTCEYHYVLSDRSGNIRATHCDTKQVTEFRAGQQHPLLPKVPDDVVLISGGDRAKLLSQRIQENYGQIDVPKLIEIIKRPVAMESNLHDAIFAPETLEMWFADAGKHTAACDEPYAHLNLRELIQFYAEQAKPKPQ